MPELRIQKEMTETHSSRGAGDDLSTSISTNQDFLASPRTTGTRVQGLLICFFCAVKDNIT